MLSQGRSPKNCDCTVECVSALITGSLSPSVIGDRPSHPIYQALDNGFASCADPQRLQAICEQLGPQQIDQLLRRWLARLPHPFTPQDRAAGYRYDVSILQAEFSLTQILDRPLSGASSSRKSFAKTSTWAVPTECN